MAFEDGASLLTVISGQAELNVVEGRDIRVWRWSLPVDGEVWSNGAQLYGRGRKGVTVTVTVTVTVEFKMGELLCSEKVM